MSYIKGQTKPEHVWNIVKKWEINRLDIENYQDIV